jgi:tRNA-specific 2-thiouridylase
MADRVTWVAGKPPAGGPFEGSVRIRYRGNDAPAVIEPDGLDRAMVEFRTPQRAVAPGQSVVLDAGDEVLGGGRIVEALA